MSHHGRGRAGTEQALWHAQTRCRSGPDTQNSKFTARRSNRTVFNSASSRILITSWLWLFLAQTFSQTPSFHPCGSRRGVCKKMKRTPTPAAFPWNSFVLCASFPVIPGRNELSTTDSLPHERRRETVETMYFCGLCSSLPSQRVCAGKKLSALLET